jgi:hypothetical protein
MRELRSKPLLAFNHLKLKFKRTWQFEKIIQDINFSELIENLSEQHSDNDGVNAEDESDVFVGYIEEMRRRTCRNQVAFGKKGIFTLVQRAGKASQ